MKKTYIAPQAEIVKLIVSSSILEPDITRPSYGAGNGGDDDFADGKEHTGLWGDVDDEDTWSGSKGADLWGSDDDEEEW